MQESDNFYDQLTLSSIETNDYVFAKLKPENATHTPIRPTYQSEDLYALYDYPRTRADRENNVNLRETPTISLQAQADDFVVPHQQQQDQLESGKNQLHNRKLVFVWISVALLIVSLVLFVISGFLLLQVHKTLASQESIRLGLVSLSNTLKLQETKLLQTTDDLKTKGLIRPIGLIQIYAGNEVPELPWLICNGSTISRSDFPKLFAVIGTIYGSGDRNTTFNLPDLRARIPMGADAKYKVGKSGGENSHSLSINELPSHNHGVGSLKVEIGGQHSHPIYDPGHDHGGKTGYSNIVEAKQTGENKIKQTSGKFDRNVNHYHVIQKGVTGIKIPESGIHSHKMTGQTGLIGNSSSFNLLPPFVAFNYVIYAK
jgi:hypothetical protein